MSAINVNSITGRTGSHGPVLTGITTATNGLHVTGAGSSVGIGTDDPSGLIHGLINADAQLIFQNSSQNNLYVSGTNASVVTDATGSSFPGFIVKTGGTFVGNLTAQGTSSLDLSSGGGSIPLLLKIGSDEKVRITSGGVGVNTVTVPAGVNVAVGGTIRVQDSTDATQYLTINHEGINFQNTGAGSSTTAAAHTLDDYEEGTWTPGWGASGTVTTDGVVSGSYTKIGDLCYLSFVVGSTGTPTGTDTITITGIPFAPSNITNVTRYQGTFEAIYFTVDSTTQYSLAHNGLGALTIRKMTNGGGNTASSWSEVANTSVFEMRGTITYKVA